MRLWFVVPLLVAIGACGDDGGQATDGGIADAAPDPDGCTPYAEQRCSGGDLYWFDSCGTQIELASECPLPSECNDITDGCCDPPSTGQIFRSNYPGDINWTFPARGDSLTATFTFRETVEGTGMMFVAQPSFPSPGGAVPLWIAPQTSLSSGSPGLLISRLGYDCPDEMNDDCPDGPIADNVQETGPGAFIEGTGPQNFVGLRQPLTWAEGESYTVTLSRGEAAGSWDWIDVSITTESTSETIDAGRIKLERGQPAEPVTFPTTFESQLVLYSYGVNYDPGADPPMVDYEELPTWAFEVWFQVGGSEPEAAVSSYNLDGDGVGFDN
ncbi:MAG: hypothetical protein KJO07_18740, partial [Deltaproteobacteria bacterium]|nr:hypothetical protein [Deltaproteobacteria bacterium]